jgi:hypothetical protein
MSVTVVVEGKVAGEKRSLFTDWRINLPPIWEADGDRLKLRDLITSIVAKEVEAFKSRQEARKLDRIMSKAEIETGAARGKISPEARNIVEVVDLDSAVAAALQAFTDGLYFVFIDGIQQTDLDREVYLKSESKVTFLRLVALAGG